jgi:O-acetyl-ADP-ribose deacetylase (regulator of RNase III)
MSLIKYEMYELHALNIHIFKGDITKLSVDCIVNAANENLAGGCGVDGAIHKAAGPSLAILSSKYAPLECGESIITPAFNLPCDYVIHTVGPRYIDGNNFEDVLLSNAYLSAFETARIKGCRTIALPAISCGIFGYPIEEATKTAYRIATYYSTFFDEILFPCVDNDVYECFKKHERNTLPLIYRFLQWVKRR